MKWMLQLIVLILFVSIWMQGNSAFGENNDNKATNTNSSDCKFSKIEFPKELKKYEVMPWQILKNKEFKTKYYIMLANRANVKWLKTLSGPSTTNLLLDTKIGRFVLVTSCMPNNCNTTYIYIIYNIENQKIYGLLMEKDKPVWLGNPNDSIRCLLYEIHKEDL